MIETIERSLRRVDQTFAARFIEDLLDEIGTRACLADQTLLGKFDDHALGSRGDQACFHFDKCLSLTRGRDGHIFDGRFSVFDVLEELFHFCNFRS